MLLLLAQCFISYNVQTLLFIFHCSYSGVTPVAPLKQAADHSEQAQHNEEGC